MKALRIGSASSVLTALVLMACNAELAVGSGTPQTPPPPQPPPPASTAAPEPPPPPKKLAFRRRQLVMAGNAKLSGDQIKIPGAIQFESGKSTIRESDATTAEILNTMNEVLSKNPQITKMAIDGHTDNEGQKGFNQTLSDGRAAAVVKWLVGKGIAQERLESKGYGMEKPLAPNTTAANKQLNRRVEFRLVELDGKPYTPAATEGEGAPAPSPPAEPPK